MQSPLLSFDDVSRALRVKRVKQKINAKSYCKCGRNGSTSGLCNHQNTYNNAAANITLRKAAIMNQRTSRPTSSASHKKKKYIWSARTHRRPSTSAYSESSLLETMSPSLLTAKRKFRLDKLQTPMVMSDWGWELTEPEPQRPSSSRINNIKRVQSARLQTPSRYSNIERARTAGTVFMEQCKKDIRDMEKTLRTKPEPIIVKQSYDKPYLKHKPPTTTRPPLAPRRPITKSVTTRSTCRQQQQQYMTDMKKKKKSYVSKQRYNIQNTKPTSDNTTNIHQRDHTRILEFTAKDAPRAQGQGFPYRIIRHNNIQTLRNDMVYKDDYGNTYMELSSSDEEINNNNNENNNQNNNSSNYDNIHHHIGTKVLNDMTRYDNEDLLNRYCWAPKTLLLAAEQ